MILPSRHFSPFKLFLHPATGTALMLNPKVATTFTRRFLAQGFVAELGFRDPSDGRYRFMSLPRRFPTARVRDYAGFFADPGRYDLYAFVRNPYARLLSAWRNKFLDPHLRTPDHSESAYPRSMRLRELAPVRRFAAAHALSGDKKDTLVPFETFLAYAAAQPEGRRDHHWDTQTSVLMTDRLRYARIFRIEDEGNEGFLTIGRRLGFSDDWMRERLGRPANRSRTKASYTAETAALARPLVARDLEFFGYAPDSWTDT